MQNMVVALFVILLTSTATVSAASPFDPRDKIATNLIKKDAEYKLIFFGYAGCYHFCDPRLRQIDPIYKALKKSIEIKMLFIDISKETTQNEAVKFVQEVNNEFEAISPDAKEVELLQKKFQDVFISRMPDGEYMHSGFLYLLKRHQKAYYLLKIYPEFIHTQAVIADIVKITGK